MATATKWGKIADQLRSQIVNGHLAAGDKLPTEAHLVAENDVARNTVRQALGALQAEGLIVPRPPQGWFVRERQAMTYRPQAESANSLSPEMDEFMRTHSAEGREPSQHIDVAIVKAPEFVQKRLGLEEGATVVVRRRVRFLDGEPFNINDTYFPLDLVKDSDIMTPSDIPRGANTVMTELGHEQTRALDEFHIRMPQPDEMQKLKLAPGTPVACHIATGYTSDDRPVRVQFNILPGDRHVIVYQRDFTPKESVGA